MCIGDICIYVIYVYVYYVNGLGFDFNPYPPPPLLFFPRGSHPDLLRATCARSPPAESTPLRQPTPAPPPPRLRRRISSSPALGRSFALRRRSESVPAAPEFDPRRHRRP